MRAFRLVVVACAFASAVVACGASSAGAAVKVGTDTSSSGTSDRICSHTPTASCTFINTGLMAPLVGTAPSDGVVVFWRVRGDSAAKTFVPRVVHPLGGGNYTGAGTGTPRVVAPGAERGFPDRLVIRAGDSFGVDVPGDTVAPSIRELSAGPAGTWVFWQPFLADNDPGRPFLSVGGANDVLLFNADIEPDADRDGFGDETQDACLGAFGSINGCPKADLQLIGSPVSQGAESDEVTYTVTVNNNGPDPVPDARILSALPAGATFVSLSGPAALFISGNDPSCMPIGRSGVGCPIASGFSATFTAVARLKAGTQTATATISSPGLTYAARISGAGDPNPANDTVSGTVIVAAPAVSKASALPKTFRLGSLLPKFSRRAHIGTTISFKLSEPSSAALTFSQPKTGRKVGRRCVTQTRSNKSKPRCTIPNVRGTLTFSGHAGTNRVRFQGRLSRSKKLKPGRYTLTITATDSAGNRSAAKSTTFTMVR